MTMTTYESPQLVSPSPRPRVAIGAMAGPITITALPQPLNLVLYRHDSFAMTISVSGDDGEPVDLAGATIDSHIRENPDDDAIVARFEISVAANVVTLTLEPGASLPAHAVWDVQMIDAGWTTTLAAGTITTHADVTRP